MQHFKTITFFMLFFSFIIKILGLSGEKLFMI